MQQTAMSSYMRTDVYVAGLNVLMEFINKNNILSTTVFTLGSHLLSY